MAGTVVIGGNSGDGMLQAPYVPRPGLRLPRSLAEFKGTYLPYFPNRTFVERVADVYRAHENATEAASLIGADLGVLCPNRGMLRAAVRQGRRAFGYYYSFAETVPYLDPNIL